jgi:hypothetical protein
MRREIPLTIFAEFAHGAIYEAKAEEAGNGTSQHVS